MGAHGHHTLVLGDHSMAQKYWVNSLLDYVSFDETLYYNCPSEINSRQLACISITNNKQ